MDDASSLKKSRIARQIEEAKERHRTEMYERRIETARNAFTDLKQGKFNEAVKGFHTYIRILEEGKGVSPGGLEPSLFDQTKDASELLLISGVYWDLAKIYDRAKGGKKKAELDHFLQKWLIFSRKMPHQKVSIDTIQKYLATNQTIHRAEFARAYQTLSQSKCFIATSLIGELSVSEIDILRKYRDARLLTRRMGRKFVALYYKYSPKVSYLLMSQPRFIRAVVAAPIRLWTYFR